MVVPGNLAPVGSKMGSTFYWLQWVVLEQPTCKIPYWPHLPGYGYGYAVHQIHPTVARHKGWGSPIWARKLPSYSAAPEPP